MSSVSSTTRFTIETTMSGMSPLKLLWCVIANDIPFEISVLFHNTPALEGSILLNPVSFVLISIDFAFS